jgi:hypothetical protein
MTVELPDSEKSAMRASAWIFPWRRSFRCRWSLLLAAMIVLPVLALLLTTVRVRVFLHPPALNRSGEMVLVPGTLDNRQWLEKIVQETPFPDAGRDDSIERWSDASLRAELRVGVLSGQQLRNVTVPASDPVFEENGWLPPGRTSANVVAVPSPAEGKVWQPRPRWLSRLGPEQVPAVWPYYAGPMTGAAGGKYLLEVNREGRVVSCVVAGKESDTRVVALENWLRRLRFPESKQGLGWLACEIDWQYEHD